MANATHSHSQHKPAVMSVERANAVLAMTSFAIVIGLFVDGWAHFHGRVDESFFTPYHALLYSAFFLTAAFVVSFVFQHVRHSSDWRQAIPDAYGRCLVGVAIFAGGGVFDGLWHTFFGIEQDVEALISPSHLLLALGGFLLTTTPIVSLWRRADSKLDSWRTAFPLVLALLTEISFVTFFTSYNNPTVQTYASYGGDVNQILGISGAVMYAMILVGCLLIVLVRWQWQLPIGALLFIIVGHGMLLSVLTDHYFLIIAHVVAGISAETLRHYLDPANNLTHLRLFTVALPFSFFATYFALLYQQDALQWSIHMWGGTIVVSAIVGLFISLLAAPPAITH